MNFGMITKRLSLKIGSASDTNSDDDSENDNIHDNSQRHENMW